MVLAKDELIFLVVVVSLSFLLLITFFVILMLRAYRVKSNREIAVLNAIIETQELERKRIAEDIHDEIGPFMSAIKLQVDSFRLPADEKSFIKKVESASKNIDDVVKEIRSVVRNLSPISLTKFGLIKSLEDFFSNIENTKTVRINFTYDGINTRLDEKAELNIFRIIIEMINNSIKHSACSDIFIHMSMNDRKLQIIYKDDGKNKASEKKQLGGGMGLKNIESRVSMFSGEITYDKLFLNGASYKITFDKKNILNYEHSA